MIERAKKYYNIDEDGRRELKPLQTREEYISAITDILSDEDVRIWIIREVLKFTANMT